MKWHWFSYHPSKVDPNVFDELRNENGDPVIFYAGCGSHAIEVRPDARALLETAPELLAALEDLLRDAPLCEHPHSPETCRYCFAQSVISRVKETP